MIITSIFVFLTLIYREIGKYIVHPAPIKWKNKIDNKYLLLCERIKVNRLERNSALETTFKITSLVGFMMIILLTIIVGRNKFLLELAIILCIVLNLNFSFKGKKHFIQESLKAFFFAVALCVIGIILMEFRVLENNELRIFKHWIGQIFGDQNYINRSTFIFYCALLIVVSAIIGFLFRLVIGILNEIVYYLISLIIRFSQFLGELNALGVLLFMITSFSYIISAIWEYNK